MYFGTLVTHVHREQDLDNWKRDIDAAITPAPGRWRMFRQALGRALNRAAHPFGTHRT